VKQLACPASLSPFVSRETMEKLEIYKTLLVKWNKAINLVSKTSLVEMWDRHFVDSLQLLQIIDFPHAQDLIDIGSGAGFPGMVLAVTHLFKKVTLIEKDQRKCVFLKEVARQTSTTVDIVNGDYENIRGEATVITARGVDKISHLLPFFKNLGVPSCYGLFLKGENYSEELKSLDPKTYTLYPSLTSVKSKIIKVWFNR
jgi:16S rRNA (guanine527-N7)-methyltransferase